MKITNAVEGLGEESLDTTGGIVNWCSPYGNQYKGSLKNFKIDLSDNPVMPHLETILEGI